MEDDEEDEHLFFAPPHTLTPNPALRSTPDISMPQIYRRSNDRRRARFSALLVQVLGPPSGVLEQED